MKKQILFLALLVVAIIANVNSSYGQALAGSAPRGVVCSDDALHPIAGKPYDYSAVGNPTGGNFLWWATKDPNFISTTTAGVTTNNSATKLLSPTSTPTGTALINTSSNYGVAGTADVVSITWSDAILSTTRYQGTPSATPTVANPSPTFVAVLYDNVVCANNLKIYELNPVKAFTVDIRSLEDVAKTPLGYDVDTESQCIDVVRTATYSGGAMQYNYGTNTLYYEVIAANFSNSWTPTFTISGLGNGQTVTSTTWTYDNPISTPWTAATVWHPATDVVNTSVTNTSTGVSIYVRVVIANNTFEGIAPTTIKVAVDGVNSVGEWDIENNNPTTPGPLCAVGSLNDHADEVDQIINPRPSIIENVTTIPANGAPQDIVPGNQTN